MIAILIVFAVLLWSLLVFRAAPKPAPAPSACELESLLREIADVRRERAEVTALVAELSAKYGVGRGELRRQIAAYKRAGRGC